MPLAPCVGASDTLVGDRPSRARWVSSRSSWTIVEPPRGGMRSATPSCRRSMSGSSRTERDLEIASASAAGRFRSADRLDADALHHPGDAHCRSGAASLRVGEPSANSSSCQMTPADVSARVKCIRPRGEAPCRSATCNATWSMGATRSPRRSWTSCGSANSISSTMVGPQARTTTRRPPSGETSRFATGRPGGGGDERLGLVEIAHDDPDVMPAADRLAHRPASRSPGTAPTPMRSDVTSDGLLFHSDCSLSSDHRLMTATICGSRSLRSG